LDDNLIDIVSKLRLIGCIDISNDLDISEPLDKYSSTIALGDILEVFEMFRYPQSEFFVPFAKAKSIIAP
jgi:hypothetical protein